MVVVRRTGNSPMIRVYLADCFGQVADASVKIIRWTEKGDGTRNLLQADVIAQRSSKKRTLVMTIADASTGRRRSFDSRVHGRHDRQLAAHRVTVDPEPVWIDLRLLFQKCQSPACRKSAQKPAAVSRRLNLVQSPCRWLRAWKHVAGIPARGMIAVNRPPVGRQFVSGVVCLAFPE